MRYKLTYQGPSGLYSDLTSKTTWEVGEAQEVSEAAAHRCCPAYFEQPEPPRDPRLAGGPLPLDPPSPHAAQWIVEPVEPLIGGIALVGEPGPALVPVPKGFRIKPK